MGTCNFAHPKNASKYFVVLTNRDEEYKQCDECLHRHYSYDYNLEELTKCENRCENPTFTEETETRYPEDWEHDELVESINEQFIHNDYEVYDYKINNVGNSYGSTVICELRSNKYYGDVCVEISVIPIITNAYYEGATLDYLIRYDGSDYEGRTDDFLDDYFDWNSEMSKGLQVIQKRYAETWIENEIEKMTTHVEEVFEQFSEHKLQRDGVFSNGEAIYSKVR